MKAFTAKVFLVALIGISFAAPAKVVGRYQLNIDSRPSNSREPAFIFAPEEGWHCQTVSTVSYRETHRDESGPAIRSNVLMAPSLLETSRIAIVFQRDMESGASEAQLLVREVCSRDREVASASWICSVGDALPDRLWHTQDVECIPSHYSIPSRDTQSQLLIALRNRNFHASFTLRDKRNDSQL